jgi:hypothetical protein
MRAIYPPDGLSHIGSELISTTEHTLSERGYFARPGETTRGVNEAGLAFTCAMVIEAEGAEKGADPTHYADVTERMMRTCESVPDAIELFRFYGRVNPAYTVLLADAEGNLAQLEVGNFGIEIFKQFSKDKPGVVFSVNCYQSETLESFNKPVTQLDNLDNNNAARLERGKMLAKEKKGGIDVAQIALILSDHENGERDPAANPFIEAWGYSICNHGTRHKDEYPHEDLPWGTVSSEILEPSTQTFWYSYGWPCGETPSFGDQIFQDRSWGKYLPFNSRGFGQPASSNIKLTTPSGDILPDGVLHFGSALPV